MRTIASYYKWLQNSSRTFCSKAAKSSHEVLVYLSCCHDVYRNLAFEDWVYDNIDLSEKRILFLWRNEPSVVIGRHQSPWLECNLQKLEENKIHLARRKSGGGTVYHDLGNLNLTFFTHRSLYNRPENLALIVKVLRERWKLDVLASPRDDILLENKFKVSGTSSKLGRLTAYHHCTLLLDVNTKLLHDSLQPTYPEMTTNATASVKSSVKNLCSVDSSLHPDGIAMAIAEEYTNMYRPGSQLNVKVIDPSDDPLFPGIDKYVNELKSWQWIFGKTPKFELPLRTRLSSGNIKVTFHCYHGIIQDFAIETSCQSLTDISNSISSSLKGMRFHADDISCELEDVKQNIAPSNIAQQYLDEIHTWLGNVL